MSNDLYILILELSESLKWPVVVVFGLFLLQKPLVKMLNAITLKTLKYGDMEAHFEQTVSKVAMAADNSGLEQNSDDNAGRSPLLDVSPKFALIESWQQIEKAITGYLHRIGCEDLTPTVEHLKYANADYGTIGAGVFQMITELRGLRNRAVHLAEFEVSREAAEEYIQLASRVINRIEEA